MAGAFVQSWVGVSDSSADTSAEIAKGAKAALTAGNIVILAVRYTTASGAPTVTGTIFEGHQLFTQALAGTITLDVYWGVAAGGEETLAITKPSGVTVRLAMAEVSSINTSAPERGTASTNNASASTCSTGTVATTPQAGDVAIAILAVPSAITSVTCADAVNTPPDFTMDEPAITGTIVLHIAHKDITVAGNQTGTFSWTTARTSAAGIVVLAQAAAGGGTAGWSGQDYAPRKRRDE